MRVVIELPIPSRVLSPNGRFHWGAKQRATKKAREYAHYVTLAAFTNVESASLRWPEASVSVRVVRRDKRGRMDDQNLIASLKAYIDGVCDAGLIENDRGLRWGAVTWEVERGIPKNQERVELTFSAYADRD